MDTGPPPPAGPPGERLIAIAGQIMDAAKRNNIPEYMHLDAEFDRIIADAGRNHFCGQAVLPLHALCRRYWAFHHRKGDPLRAARLHCAVMRAVAKGNAETAGKASDKLIDYLEEFTRASMDLYSQGS